LLVHLLKISQEIKVATFVLLKAIIESRDLDSAFSACA